MKRFFIMLFAVAALSATAKAQDGFSLGLRVGDAYTSYYGGWGYGIEASGVIGLSDRNRVEIDFGWDGYGRWYDGYGRYYSRGYLHVAGSYQWYWNIIKGLGWFVGPQANLGVFFNSWEGAYYGSLYTSTGNFYRARFSLGVGAQVGIQYDFDFPLQLALDYRPSINFMIPGHPYYYGGWANFSVRYRF